MPHAISQANQTITNVDIASDVAHVTVPSSMLTPTVIDNLIFARDGRNLAGCVPLADLSRLNEDMPQEKGELAVDLQGWRDDEGKSWLRLRIGGELVVSCQRCLESMLWPLSIDSLLQVVAPGEAWPDEDLTDDAAEAIEADTAMDVVALVEDEVLLALPVVLMHAQCTLPLAATDVGESPFAMLAALKQR